MTIVVTSLDVLVTADHIEWERLGGYSHHAIVESVDYETGEVHVIEYGSDKGGSSKGKGVVRRHTVHGVERMKKHEYICEDECFEPEEVLERAKSQIDERQYRFFGNNCEHFARWCKTGKKMCSQILPFIARGVVGSFEYVSGGCGTFFGRCVAKCSVEAAKNGTTINAELDHLWQCGGNEIWNAATTGGKEIGNNALKSQCKVLIIGGVAVLVEAGLFGYNWYKIHQKYRAAAKLEEDDDKREMYRQQERKEIKRAAFESVGGAIGATVIGAAVGSVIPVFGTAAGALAGSIAVRLIGRWLSQ